MMKASAKPRRTKEEIKEAKLKEEAEKLEIELKLKRYEEMQQELANQQEVIRNNEMMSSTMSSLFDQCLIK